MRMHSLESGDTSSARGHQAVKGATKHPGAKVSAAMVGSRGLALQKEVRSKDLALHQPPLTESWVLCSS